MKRPNSYWTDERCAVVRDLHARGFKVLEIARHFGVSKGSAGGIIFRMGLAERRWPESRRAPKPTSTGIRMALGARVHRAEVTPAKYPYAPDDTCPDFAWDDQHCDAVIAQGGFAAFKFRTAA